MEAECFENIVSVPTGVGLAIVLCHRYPSLLGGQPAAQGEGGGGGGELQVQFHYPLGAQGGWLILGRPRLFPPIKRLPTVLATWKAIPGEESPRDCPVGSPCDMMLCSSNSLTLYRPRDETRRPQGACWGEGGGGQAV